MISRTDGRHIDPSQRAVEVCLESGEHSTAVKRGRRRRRLHNAQLRLEEGDSSDGRVRTADQFVHGLKSAVLSSEDSCTAYDTWGRRCRKGYPMF